MPATKGKAKPKTRRRSGKTTTATAAKKTGTAGCSMTKSRWHWDTFVSHTWVPPWPYEYTSGSAACAVKELLQMLIVRKHDVPGERLVVLALDDKGCIYAGCGLMSGWLKAGEGWNEWEPVAVAALLGAHAMALAFVRGQCYGCLNLSKDERMFAEEAGRLAESLGLRLRDVIVVTDPEPGGLSWASCRSALRS